MSRHKKVKTNKFYKFLSYLLLFCSVLVISILLYFEVLPARYFAYLGIILGLIVLFLIIKLNSKTKRSTKAICVLISIILVGVELLGTFYSFGTIDFLNNIFDQGNRLESYGIYALNDSSYKSLKDLKNQTICIYQSDEEIDRKAYKKLQNKIKFYEIEITSIKEAINSLEDNNCNGIFINESVFSSYLEEKDINNINLIDKIDIIIKSDSNVKKVNVTKEPFVIYVSGVDNTGKITKNSRSDVNILIFVNPKEKKVLLINTPRDYYVTLASKNAKDKLTHAGIYGIDESLKSLELLYDTDINYYIRLNFTSFLSIIDSLGGITVDVEKPNYRYNNKVDCGVNYICEQNSNREFGNKMIYIKSGVQNLNAEQALAYARNRHQYISGDLARGKHQQQIIEAVIDKASSPNILLKYNSLLKSLSNSMLTNFDQKTITKLINYQLNNNIDWEIESYNVSGLDGYEETYSIGKVKSYVIIPDEKSINTAKDKIKAIMNIES